MYSFGFCTFLDFSTKMVKFWSRHRFTVLMPMEKIFNHKFHYGSQKAKSLQVKQICGKYQDQLHVTYIFGLFLSHFWILLLMVQATFYKFNANGENILPQISLEATEGKKSVDKIDIRNISQTIYSWNFSHFWILL